MPSTSVETPRSPSRRMCALASTRSSCPATSNLPSARMELSPRSLNLTCDAPSSRFMSSKVRSTSPSMLPMTAPRTDVGRSPVIRTFLAAARTFASETRSAATSGIVTSTSSRRLSRTWVRNGKPLMSTSGAVARCSSRWSLCWACFSAYITAQRSASRAKATRKTAVTSSLMVMGMAAKRLRAWPPRRCCGGAHSSSGASSSSYRRPRRSGSSSGPASAASSS